MKKFGQFVLSLVQPRKLAKYRNMHIALSILIFIVAMFVALGSQYMMSESYVQKEMTRFEYKGTLASLYGSNDLKGRSFNENMQTMTFSSDLSISIDEEKNRANITKNVLVEKFTYGELNLPIEVSIYFDNSFVGDSADEKNTKPFEDFVNKIISESLSTEEKVFFYFGKVNIYYLSSNQIPLMISSNISSGLEIFNYIKNLSQYATYTDEVNGTTINSALAYLQRIPNRKISDVKYEIANEGTVNEKEIATATFDNSDIEESQFVENLFRVFNLNKSSFKHLEINNNKNPYTLYSQSYYETLGIYHKMLLDKSEHKEGHFLDFTLVIDQNLNNIDSGNIILQNFDYEGYMKQTRNENTTYILIVLGFDRLFFVYDLAQDKDNNYNPFDYGNNSIFEKTDGGQYKYYRPKDDTEISYNMYGEIDTTLWTVECGKDEYTSIGNDNYYGANRHKENFYDAVYATHSRSYLYSDLVGEVVNDKTFSKNSWIDEMLQSIVNQMIKINASNYELLYAVMAFAAIVLFPLVLVLIVWAMSKRLFMKRIRQYYALAALCYGSTSILAFIVGFFLPFDKFALFLMFFQAWWFIFVTYRINTDPKYNNGESGEDESDNADKHSQIQFKKIKEKDEIKPSSIG